MDIDHQAIENKWHKRWQQADLYKVTEDPDKPKYYILDMFPYPSGAGLHVGHPLGYIATDILARYKRMQGFNVLHPMGFDAFGLPAEQYAIETGQHPRKTTEENIATYKKQLKKIGFCYDWSREVITADPKFYKWTQWIFLQLFDHWYDKKLNKARPIADLVKEFKVHGNTQVSGANDRAQSFTAEEWKSFSEKEQQQTLLKYRLAYQAYAEVNWCPALGTVLANDEVKDGVSERGGHPVYRKKMRQWFLRITAYAERLLEGLERIDWPHSLKEMQRNWIGRSEGARVWFPVQQSKEPIEIFTTRPDTIFGATYMVLAPEHDMVERLTTDEQREQVAQYLEKVKSRTDVERQQEKQVSGVFTGSYAINPMTEQPIPIWVAEYVLVGYGTGAIMAVPSDDERDHAFAEKFGLPIIGVVDKSEYPDADREEKVGKMMNSGFLDGMEVMDAIQAVIDKLEAQGIGKRTINYRLRDAGFSRQRYWGEPFPIVYKDEVPYTLDEDQLPLELPEIESYKPTAEGEAPLARNAEWVNEPAKGTRETDTMPGYAGSSWYFLRYMDPHNEEAFASKEKIDYWQEVDFYIGGAEHAVGHLIYARFWHKFLYDLGYVPTDEPFKKLVNQGMIQGQSKIIYRVKDSNTFISRGLKDSHDTVPMHVNVSLVKNDVLDIAKIKTWRDDFQGAEFILENGEFHTDTEIEKMSKRWHNVVNPDDVIDEHGADVFRMYEMFLGPITDHKPWDTQGIDGVSRFLRKLVRLVTEGELDHTEPTKEELKILHTAIKKVKEDMETLSFNTAVSAMMICVNELSSLNCSKSAILKDLARLIAPFAPFVAEEMWQERLGQEGFVLNAGFPNADESYLVEDEHEYPVSINGKMRTKLKLPVDMPKEEVEERVLADEVVQKWLDGKAPKKVIVVPKRIVNVVV